MNLKPDSEFLQWLKTELSGIEWDPGNLNKISKHGGSVSLVEKMLSHEFYLAGRIVRPGEPRWLILGKVEERGWALIATQRGTLLRPISFRRQRPAEEKWYETFEEKTH
jgi:uncharacterized protein